MASSDQDRTSSLKEMIASVKDFRASVNIPYNFGDALESRRWVILFAYFLYSYPKYDLIHRIRATSAIAYLTYAPIPIATSEYFEIQQEEVYEFSNAATYCFFLFSYIGAYVTYKYFACTFFFCILLNCAGGWFRYYAGPNYSLCLIGQYIIGLGAAPVGAMGPRKLNIAERWFPESERNLATCISMISNAFGFALGYLIPCEVVGADINRLELLTLIQAIACSVPFVMGVLSLKDRPDTPPSYTSLMKATNVDTWRDIKLLATDCSFLSTCLLFGSLIGGSLTIQIVMGVALEPLNLAYWQQGLIGTLYIGAGFIAAGMGIVLMEAKIIEQVDRMIWVLTTIGLACAVYLGYIFGQATFENEVSLYLLIFGAGFGLQSTVPFMVVSITESTYPVQEPLSVNLLLMVGQISCAGGSYLGFLPSLGNWGFMVGVAFVIPGWVYSLTCFRTKKKLTDVEENHKEIDEADAASILALRFDSTKDITKSKVFKSMMVRNASVAEQLSRSITKSVQY